MNKEIISDKQGIALIILFIVGTSSIQASGLDAKQDLWITVILSIFMALPVVILFGRLHVIFPQKDLFDIIEICFGKFIGKIIIMLFTFFCFETGSEVLRNFGQFVNIVTLHDTPLVIPDTIMIILCIWAVKEGIELTGRWSEFFILIVIGFLFVSVLLLIPDINMNNISPTLYNGAKPVMQGAFIVFLFPFTQILPFTMAFSTFKRKTSPYKVYTVGLIIGGILIFVISVTNILVLGINQASIVYHPSYFTTGRIDIGNFVQRVEVIITTIFSLGAFIKISIYLLGACKGVVKIFGYVDYRFIVMPIALSMLNLSCFIVDNIMEFWEWTDEVWKYYGLFFQVILPIIIWITCEIKKNRVSNLI
ncbi:GerAB/ArcD/ProY family transporter [Tepidibacter hydrothermalis]|uniref:Endospore germination permease n=1 Tax=Tepidibacter hydrothermalis TaxID=3036126 RepID=A0ABY8EB79_9FIRM|nr:endospore germination permease [Tepidibacter hydrothermalis]WFD10173.1 endospore germination permease [Tepidibacter hydrothermalis]